MLPWLRQQEKQARLSLILTFSSTWPAIPCCPTEMLSRTCVLVKPIDVFFKLISFQLIACYSESSSLSADFSTCVDLGATLVVEHGLLVAVVSLLSTRDCRRRGLCRCCWPAVEHLLSSCATWALGPMACRIVPGQRSNP